MWMAIHHWKYSYIEHHLHVFFPLGLEWSNEVQCVSSFLTSSCLISWWTWATFFKSAATLCRQHSSLPCSPSTLSSSHLSLSSPSLFSFQPKRRDTAINLRVANELHLTIKCTGNGTFHLQEDQWQWQTPFSKRLVSGMMFRRQSNQSPHTDAEINQRRKGKLEEKKDLKLLSLYSIHGLYLNKATNHSVRSPPSCPLLSCTLWILSVSFFYITNSFSPSYHPSTGEGSWEVRGEEWMITIRGVKCSITTIPICDPTSS